MKTAIPFFSFLLFLGNGVFGFPTLSTEGSNDIPEVLKGLTQNARNKRLLFDPLTTPIEVTGDHEFIAPGVDDQRGPCPGLNALANHGYINRDGVTSLVDTTAAINEVWGMGLDLATILAVMGTVFVGDPLSLDPGFSIGGESSAVENALGNVLGLLGTPRGLFGSHNIIEGDSSNTRNDLYATDDSWTLDLDLFEAWYNMSDTVEGDYNMDLMAERANIRFQDTKATNPDFYYGPFTGLIARNAGYLFSARMFANHSTAHPDGVLTKEIIKSLYAITGEPGNFTYTKGAERIPENWYRTPVDYGIVELNLDLVDWITQYPDLGDIGGNTGTVNSFTGVDLGDLTGGVLDATTLLEGNNLICLVMEVVKTAAPNSLSTVFSVLTTPLELITDAIGSGLLSLSCPAFADLSVGGDRLVEGLEALYPGASESVL